MTKVLVTGGAGFIGSHLCDELIAHGYDVGVLDNLDQQVHGSILDPPDYLNPQVQFQHGDVTDYRDVRRALRDVDAVVHLAAKVGVGQSMYQPSSYILNNNVGTSCLLQELADLEKPVSKLVVASSMSVYGEGQVSYDFGSPMEGQPVATAETKPVDLQSTYALTKYDQERLCLLWGRAYSVPTIALRFFNVYGPRQSLNNPYTGVMAIFASRLLNNQPPIIFEDGLQSRDFVHVSDIVRGIRLALEADVADEVINLGLGRPVTILTLAEGLAKELGLDIRPEITGKYRVGDIRHCFADISKAHRLLGYEPQVSIVEGVRGYAQWLKTQQATDRVEQATAELEQRGLLR